VTTPEFDSSSEADLSLPSLALRTYGEPRFHTEGDIAAVAFDPDGTVWSIDEVGVLAHWSITGELKRRAFLSDLETLWVFAPKAKRLASGNDDLLIWDTATGKLSHKIDLETWVTAIAFSPDEKTLATGHDDGSVQLWHGQTYNNLATLPAHNVAISALAFSPDGMHLATAGEDKVVRVWAVGTGKKVHEFKSHTDRVPSLSWSVDGQYLSSAGWDTSARLWKMGETDPVILLNSHAEQVMCVQFHPTAVNRLATADSDCDIYLWQDATTGKVGNILRGHIDEIRSMAFSPDGKLLASAGADRVVHLWDVESGQLLAGPNPKGKHATAVFQYQGRQVLGSTGGPFFRLWDVETTKEIHLGGDPIAAYSVAVTPDGHWLAVGGTDYFTRLFDLTQPTPTARLLEATKPPIGSVAIHPTAKLVAHTSPADGLVWVWTTDGGEAQLILIEAADGCTLEGVAFHPDGERVVVGGIDYLSTGERDGAVCVWDLETKLKTVTFDHGVYAVAVDPSGRYIAGAGINDRVYLWDLTQNELAFALEGHADKINAVTFTPDGSFVVSASDDQTLRIWDVLSGRLMVIRELDAAIQSVTFTPDGKHLFTGNSNTTCYQFEFAKLMED
jgi:WD40 repeat protein